MSVREDAEAIYGPIMQGAELESALDLLASRKLSGVLEIGAGWGSSLHCWASVVGPPYISVDYQGGTMNSREEKSAAWWKGLLKPEDREAKWHQHFAVTAIHGKSQSPEVLPEVMASAPNGIGWLFIDGQHTYEAALDDFWSYKPLVVPGGLIGLHDIYHPEWDMGRVWTDIKAVLPFRPVWEFTGEYTDARGTPLATGLGVMQI